jgi:hypothetical protein
VPAQLLHFSLDTTVAATVTAFNAMTAFNVDGIELELC